MPLPFGNVLSVAHAVVTASADAYKYLRSSRAADDTASWFKDLPFEP